MLKPIRKVGKRTSRGFLYALIWSVRCAFLVATGKVKAYTESRQKNVKRFPICADMVCTLCVFSSNRNVKSLYGK